MQSLKPVPARPVMPPDYEAKFDNYKAYLKYLRLEQRYEDRLYTALYDLCDAFDSAAGLWQSAERQTAKRMKDDAAKAYLPTFDYVLRYGK